jgi:hypothetical protein
MKDWEIIADNLTKAGWSTTKAYSNGGASPAAAASTLDLSSDTRPMMQPQKNEWKPNPGWPSKVKNL